MAVLRPAIGVLLLSAAVMASAPSGAQVPGAAPSPMLSIAPVVAATDSLSASTTSSRVALSSSTSPVLMVTNEGQVPVCVLLGNSSVVANNACAGNNFISPGATNQIGNNGQTNLAAIVATNSGTATLSVQEGYLAPGGPPVFVNQAPLTPLGFCPLSVGSSAVSLSSCSGGIPAGATKAAVTMVETEPLRWRDDGMAPTASVGNLVNVGSGFALYQNPLSSVQFISTTGTATLDVSFYK